MASVSTGGTLSITTSVAASADLPDGTIVSYSASANLFDASFSNSHSVSGSAKVAARKITISLKLPYFWKVVATGENMTVSMRLSANVSAPSGVSRSLSTNFSKTLATPANNATTSIAFSGSL
ncbi:hypothetical protein [Methylosinus sp. Sm6]|uniref:hypothetical protein n=1 Tax=Methylosinus sp. Sm6 TaxID=2866948 RepID=UPI001C99DCA2|nr:hypothetical protein [Methylosinus sp. Sm6]MBY6243193.1 hypothetical protein [Methylosinus sp. Sm6]